MCGKRIRISKKLQKYNPEDKVATLKRIAVTLHDFSWNTNETYSWFSMKLWKYRVNILQCVNIFLFNTKFVLEQTYCNQNVISELAKRQTFNIIALRQLFKKSNFRIYGWDGDFLHFFQWSPGFNRVVWQLLY